MNTETFIKNTIQYHSEVSTNFEHTKVTIKTVIGIIQGFKKHWTEPHVTETLDDIVEKLKTELGKCKQELMNS